MNLTAIEVKTINSLESWNEGIVVMVSGLVKTKDFSSKRKFVQTFFLAPQEKGYFVLNDIFQFFEEEPIFQQPACTMTEDKVKMQLNAASSLSEPPGMISLQFRYLTGYTERGVIVYTAQQKKGREGERERERSIILNFCASQT